MKEPKSSKGEERAEGFCQRKPWKHPSPHALSGVSGLRPMQKRDGRSCSLV